MGRKGIFVAAILDIDLAGGSHRAVTESGVKSIEGGIMDVVPLASGTRADRSGKFQPKGQSAAPVASAASSDSGWDECRRGLTPAMLMRRWKSQ
jgi:hypothetical protein